jgi:hypothetical protein
VPKYELDAERANVGDAELAELELARPKTRGECVDGARPCPFVGCRHHLFLDLEDGAKSIKLNFPDVAVEDLEHSCSLDVADMGGANLDDVGDTMNVTRERIRQIEGKLLAQFRNDATGDLDDFADGKRHLPVLRNQRSIHLDEPETRAERNEFAEEPEEDRWCAQTWRAYTRDSTTNGHREREGKWLEEEKLKVLTPRMVRAFDFVAQWIAENERGPSMGQIAKGLGISPTAPAAIMRTLRLREFVSFQNGDYSTMRILKSPHDPPSTNGNGSPPAPTPIAAAIVSLREERERRAAEIERLDRAIEGLAALG